MSIAVIVVAQREDNSTAADVQLQLRTIICVHISAIKKMLRKGNNNMEMTDLDKYIEEKLRILKEDFKIKLKKPQINRLMECKSDFEVDRIARDIIMSM